MVGADPDVYARIEPVQRAFAENTFHVGGRERGMKSPSISSPWAIALIGEALVAAQRSGVDVEAFFKVVTRAGRTPASSR